jgi:O-antigen/teichoic acid export membrane protein
MTHDSTALTRGSLLARNVGINLIGWTLPAIAGLVGVPLLVRGLGDARFGLLTLAWTTIGYFSLFDLGIGRALTHAVADRIGRGNADQVSAVSWTAIALLAPLGMMGGVALYVAAPFLATEFLQVPPDLEAEAITAFRVLSLAIPVTGATAALRGILEATQRFMLVNALRVPFGVLTFVGPLLALPFSRSVVAAVWVLTVGRIALFIAHVVACARVIPGITTPHFNRATLVPLLGFGGWMTVSNIVSPLMNTLDRFIIGAVMTVDLVTYYATPHELVTKMWLFTAALLPVFFPAFATTAAAKPGRTALLFDRVLRVTFAALFLPTLALVLLSREILLVWLGPAFGGDSTTVMQVLAVAIFVNTLGQGALTLIQGLGRPDITGRLHLMELPVYGLLLWWLLPRYGIVGAAMAWAARAILDSVLLLRVCPVLLPEARPALRRIWIWTVLALPALALCTQIPWLSARVALFLTAVPAWLAFSWFRILTPSERQAPLKAIGLTLTRSNGAGA